MNTTHIDAPQIDNSRIVASPAQLKNAVYQTPLTDTEQVFDYSQNKTQEEFNIEVAGAIINLQNQEQNIDLNDYYNKEEIDSKVNLINQGQTNLTTSLNTEYTRATTKESELAGRISNLETAAPNYITADSLEKYNSSKTVKFNGIISSATIVPEGYDGSSSTLYIYYIEDKKTFGASRTIIPSGILSASLAIEWTDRLLYAKNQIASVPTVPYEDKIYICKGIAYIWTGTELKAIGVDGLKAYYNNNEISSINITDTITSGDAYDSYIPSNIVINNLNSRIEDLERRISILENSSSNNPTQGEISNGNTEIEDPTTDPGTTVTP